MLGKRCTPINAGVGLIIVSFFIVDGVGAGMLPRFMDLRVSAAR